MRLKNRQEAGRRLGARLKTLGIRDAVVIALPRGGVPVAKEVASALGAPLDVVIVRKIGHPEQPEFGIGALSEDDFHWLDPDAARQFDLDPAALEEVLLREASEVRRRVHKYRGGRPLTPVEGKTVVLVDDGLATGVTARAAAHLMRGQGAENVILAVPVGASASARSMIEEGIVDDLVALSLPEDFHAVGQWYEDFDQVSDEEVIQALESSRNATEELLIALDDLELPGILTVPAKAKGLVIFAHGSGSSRLSPRNQKVARALNASGFATLLFDLLTEDEARFQDNVFDIPRLAQRLLAAADFVRSERDDVGLLPLGLFGASTGVAATLVAAAQAPGLVQAIVGRSGRPDLAAGRLQLVQAPSLFIVGGRDPAVAEMNQEAARAMRSASVITVPGATHLFEEPGTLNEVCRHATDWFARYLYSRMAAAA